MLSACNIAAQSSQMSPVIRGLKWHFVGSWVVDTDWMTLPGYQLPRGHRSLSEGIVAVSVCWTSLSTSQEKLWKRLNKDVLHVVNKSVFLSLLLHKDKTYFVFFSNLAMKQSLTNKLFSNTTDHLSVSIGSLNSLFFQEYYQTIIILWCHHNCLLWMWCIPST